MSQLEADDDGPHEPNESFDNLDSAAQTAPEPEEAPGVKLGQIGMILAIIPFTAFVGLCCSVLAMVLSRQVGVPNKKALIGTVVGVAWLIVGIAVSNIFFN